MSSRKRDSDSEDLQSLIMKFHNEIEDDSVEVKENRAEEDPNDHEEDEDANNDDDDDDDDGDDDDDDDKYFIDDEGNCYIKTTPKNHMKPKNKSKPSVASKGTAKASQSSIVVRSRNNAAASNAINLRPAKSKADATPQKSSNKEVRPVAQKRSPLKATTATGSGAGAATASTVKPLRSTRARTKAAKSESKTETRSDKVVIETIEMLEELVDDPGSLTTDAKESTVAAAPTKSNESEEEEIFEFDDDPANASGNADVDFVLSGKQYKLKPVQPNSSSSTTTTTTATTSHTFACSHCSYTTNKKFLISRHVRSHDAELSFKCSICERGFRSNVGLVNHLNTHMGNKPHKCKLCESSFTTSGELIRHTRYKHTKEKPHKCTECSYASVELTKLRRHMTCHTGERPYQCPHCTYASQDMFKLKRHLVIHTGEKKYQCDICKSRFTQSNSLKAHKLIHSVVDKPVFQCTLCPTTCGRKTDLRTHMANIHTSDKPIVCKRCGQELPDRYQYKLHIKTHEGEKCYRCNLCSYASVSQRHLDSHMLIHTDTKPFTCDECPLAFRQQQLLRRHKNLIHNANYKPPEPREKLHSCPSCTRVFTHKGNLIRHMETHDDTINAREERFKLKLGRNVRLQPDGSIVTVVNGTDIKKLNKQNTSIDIEEPYELTEIEEMDESEDNNIEEATIISSPPRLRNRIPTAVMKKPQERVVSSKPVIINKQLKVSRTQRDLKSQGGTFRIKEEPEVHDFTVEIDDGNDQIMVVQLVNDDNAVVVKREPTTLKINSKNCFGFEDDNEADFEEYAEPVAEVDATSQEFLQLMDMIEHDT